MVERLYNVYEFREQNSKPVRVASQAPLDEALDVQRQSSKNPFVQGMEIVPTDDDPYLAIFSSI